MNQDEARQLLAKRWYAFDFYAAVQLLAGAGWRIGRELAVIPHDRTGFPATTIEKIEFREPSGTSRDDEIGAWMLINVMGLFGSSGCLPNYFNDIIFDEMLETRLRKGEIDEFGQPVDETLRPFLGLLNDRIYYYLYQCWSSPRLVEATGADIDNYQFALLALAGIAARQDYRRLLLQCAPFFAHPTRSPWGLAQLLRTVFDCAVNLDENVPRRLEFDPSCYSRLNGAYAKMGATLILGKVTTARAQFYRIAMGPLSLNQFSALLPGGRQHRLLLDLIRMYTPMHLEPEVDLELDPAALPRLPWVLGRHPCRLGLGIVITPSRRTQGLTARLKVSAHQ